MTAKKPVSKKAAKTKNAKLSITEKYELYERSVQCPENDIEFINREFKKIFKRKPLALREDFSGTSLLSQQWVAQSPDHYACGIDLDPETLEYGRKTHVPKLTPAEQKRLQLIEGNVLSKHAFTPDVVVAFNFSYFIFKKRAQLLEYFKTVRQSLPADAAFFIDLFGGTEAFQPLVEKKSFPKHTYFWDCEGYNPLTGECLYHIHFKVGGVKHEKAFTYDWRMWTVPELCEIMEEAGFKKTITYWEGVEDDGSGDGNFYSTREAENCESWVTYIVATT